jgi:K+-transporting ATPase KdpF subunit
VDGLTLLALVTAVALAGYLLVALMKPEWFA